MVKTYHGKPCPHGHTERYVSGRRCRQCKIIIQRKHHAENRVKSLAKMKKWKAENNEQVKAYHRKYYAEHKEVQKTRVNNWRLRNLKLCCYYSSRYRKRVIEQTPPWADMSKIKEIYLNCPDGYDVDHIHPLSKGGLHVHYNLQHLPMTENRIKGAKLL